MKNYLRFWGTRGSCPVSGSAYRVYGGNTCCLEIRYGSAHIIIDAGTGIRQLGDFLLLNKVEAPINLFLGHTHWDHIIGFPFFEPIYHPEAEITIWSPNAAGRHCKQVFDDVFSSELFPIDMSQVQAKLTFRTAQQKTPVEIAPLTIDFHATEHPGVSLAFKIKTPNQTIGYVTDNEMLEGYHGPIDEVPLDVVEPYLDLIEFLAPCDLLIHEAQYSSEEYLKKVGWGHSSLSNAVALLQKTQVSQWCVTHHDPKHTDADLDFFQTTVKKLIKEHQIGCRAEWIHDMHQIELF